MGTEPTRLEPTFVEIPPAIAAEEPPLEGPILGPDQYFGPVELTDLSFLDGIALAGEEEVAPRLPTAATAPAYPLVDFKTNDILGFPTDEEANKGFKIMSEEPKGVATDFVQTDLLLPLNVMATYLATPAIFVPGNKIDIAGKAYDITPSTQNVTLYTDQVLPCNVLTLTHPESATAYVLLVGPKTAPNKTDPFTRKVICLEIDRSGRKPKVTAAVDYEERQNDPEGISHALILSGKSSNYEERPAARILYVRQNLTIDVDTWSNYRDDLSEIEQGCLDVILSWRDSQNATLFKQAENTPTDIYILDEKYTITSEQNVELGTGVSIQTYQLVNKNRIYRLIFKRDKEEEVLDCVALEPGSGREIGGLRHSINRDTVEPITTPSAVWDLLMAWKNITGPNRAAIVSINGNRYVVEAKEPVQKKDEKTHDTITTTLYSLTRLTQDEQKQSYKLTDTKRLYDSSNLTVHTVESVALIDTKESKGGLAYSTETATITLIPPAATQGTHGPQKLRLDQVDDKIQFAIRKTEPQQGKVHWFIYSFPEEISSGIDSSTGFSQHINYQDSEPGLVRGWKQTRDRQGPYLKDYNSYLPTESALAQSRPTPLRETKDPKIKVRESSNNWGLLGMIGIGGGDSQFTHAEDNDTKGFTGAFDVGLSRDFNHVGGSIFGCRVKLDLNFANDQHGVDGETETRQSPGFQTWSSTQLLGAEALMDLWDARLGIGGLAGVREYFFTSDDSMVLAGTDTVPLDYVRFMPHPVVGGELFFYAPESWMPENLSVYLGGRVMHSWQGDATGQVRDHTVDGIETNIVRTDLTGKGGFEYKF